MLLWACKVHAARCYGDVVLELMQSLRLCSWTSQQTLKNASHTVAKKDINVVGAVCTEILMSIIVN